MNVFCKETQAHLELLPNFPELMRQCSVFASNNNRGEASAVLIDADIKITPDLWAPGHRNTAVGHKSSGRGRQRSLQYGNKVVKAENGSVTKSERSRLSSAGAAGVKRAVSAGQWSPGVVVQEGLGRCRPVDALSPHKKTKRASASPLGRSSPEVSSPRQQHLSHLFSSPMEKKSAHLSTKWLNNGGERNQENADYKLQLPGNINITPPPQGDEVL